MLWLMPLIADCLASLTRTFLRRNRPLNLFTRLLRRLRAWDGRTARLVRRWRVQARDVLLPGTSVLGHTLLAALRRHRCSLHGLLLIALPHQGVTRLVTVILAVKRLLLLDSGIALP